MEHVQADDMEEAFCPVCELANAPSMKADGWLLYRCAYCGSMYMEEHLPENVIRFLVGDET